MQKDMSRLCKKDMHLVDGKIEPLPYMAKAKLDTFEYLLFCVKLSRKEKIAYSISV